MGKIWHKVHFLVEYSWFKVKVCFFLSTKSVAIPRPNDLVCSNIYMQNSSNKLSIQVSISINVNKRKINMYTLNSLTYVEATDGCEVMLSGWQKVGLVLIPSWVISHV